MDSEFIALEVPHQGEPQAYWVPDADRLLHQCLEHNATRDGVVYEEVTAANLVEWAGEVTPDIAALIERHGEHAPLYRADFLNGTLEDDAAGQYSAEPIDVVDACTAYLGDDLSGFHLVTRDIDVKGIELQWLLDYLEGPNAPRIGKCGPVAAARALRREAEAIGWIEAD